MKAICSIATSFVWLNWTVMMPAQSALATQLPAPQTLAANPGSKPRSKPAPKPKKIKFVPPDDVGEPGGRGRGGGSRGNCENFQNLTAIVPQDPKIVGLTTQAHPTFWFYLPATLPEGSRIEFTLRDSADNDVYAETFSATATLEGITQITVPTTAAALDQQQSYRWGLSVFCDRQKPNAQVFVRGTIRRTGLPKAVEQTIAAQSPDDRAILYAQKGIWYDAITTLAETGTAPNNTTWMDLLEEGGLSSLKNAAIVPNLISKAPLKSTTAPPEAEDKRLVLRDLGQFYKARNQIPTAIAFYKQAVNFSESLRQAGHTDPLSNSIARDYRVLADLLLLESRILEAQQVLELMKLQEIREFTRGNINDQTTGIATTTIEDKILQSYDALMTLGQTLAACKRSQCKDLPQLTSQFTKQLEQSSQIIPAEMPDRPNLKDPHQFLSKATAIVDAQPNTVLVYPLVMKDKLWLVWASKGGIIKSQRLPIDQRQMGEMVIKFRQQLQNPMSNPKELQATGKILYDWLIKPLASELQAKQVQNLVFSLDRTTRYIPMAALYDGQKYLVENYNISTILSADLTDLGDRIPLSPKNTATLALGVSNSVSRFSPLPNVPAELDAIVRQPDEKLGVYPGLKFLNEAFNFQSLSDNLGGHRIVHIATHAQFTVGRPERSFLLLGNGESLTIPEIQSLSDLNRVQLVVLSACETALGGPDNEGTEVSGLSSYFLGGGAKAVMASLWAVDDKSTSQLMQTFYSNLATNSITKAQALRQAQLNLLSGTKGFSHPYFWAPFVITGNGF